MEITKEHNEMRLKLAAFRLVARLQYEVDPNCDNCTKIQCNNQSLESIPGRATTCTGWVFNWEV